MESKIKDCIDITSKIRCSRLKTMNQSSPGGYLDRFFFSDSRVATVENKVDRGNDSNQIDYILSFN